MSSDNTANSIPNKLIRLGHLWNRKSEMTLCQLVFASKGLTLDDLEGSACDVYELSDEELLERLGVFIASST